jgi:large subunit ribosomal protein L10
MDRSAKEQSVGEIRETLDGVMSIILADYRGVDVPTITEIREEFRAAGCGYRVLKNTIVKIAIAGSDKEPMSALLAGPTAVIWSTESPSAAAKVAVKYAKDVKEFEIKGGFFDGEVLDVAGVHQLSTMPSKEELQASLLMTFMAAPTDLVRTLAAGPLNFLYVLQAREQSLS